MNSVKIEHFVISTSRNVRKKKENYEVIFVWNEFMPKVKNIHKCLSLPLYKADLHASTLHCITLRTGTWEHRTFTTQVKRYIGSNPYSRFFLSELDIKQQIMPNNVETQYKLMNS